MPEVLHYQRHRVFYFMETTKQNIYQKLLVIQTKVSGLGKDKKANSYSYVTGDKVLEHIKPLMNELGLILKQEVLSIDNVKIDYKTGIGTTYEKPKSEINSKVMMKFTWVDCDTMQTDENLFGANGQNDWDKGVGSALTYGERYFLLKFFHIATDEDDIDNPDLKPVDKVVTVKQTPIQQPAVKPTLNPQQFEAMLKSINEGGKETVIKAMDKYVISDEYIKALNVAIQNN